MKRSLIIVIVLCTFVAAMVPRDRRALNTEDEFLSKSTTDSPKQEFCAKNTPCAWSVYRPPFKYIEINITNSFCICSKGEACIVTEDDSTISAYVYRCREES